MNASALPQLVETVAPATPVARHKVMTLEQVTRYAARSRAAGKTVVLCHGVFD